MNKNTIYKTNTYKLLLSAIVYAKVDWSPRLFALYVNQLTNKLIVCKADCYINDMCINHVLYADDICLLAPSVSTMQSLLNVYMLYEYDTNNDI